MGNSSNAYATISPLKADLSNMISNNEKLQFDYREEERKIKEEKQKAIDLKEKRRLDFQSKMPKFVATGINTIDEYNLAGLKIASEELGKSQLRYNQLNNKNNLSADEEKELFKLTSKISNLQNYPENVTKFLQSSTESAKDYIDGVQKGLYFDDTETSNKLRNGIKGFIPGIDENGFPTAGVYDKNGDGINDVVTFNEINDGLFIKPMPKIDARKLAFQIGTKASESTETDIDGYTTTVVKEITPQQANDLADSLINEENIKSWKRFNGLDYSNVTNKDVENFKLEMAEIIRSAKGRKEESKFDFSARNQAAANAETARKNRANEAQARANEAGRNDRFNKSLKAKSAKNNESISIDEVVNYSMAKEKNKDGIPKGSLGYNFKGGKFKIPISKGIEDVVTDVFLAPNDDIIIKGEKYTKQGATKFTYNSTGQADKVGAILGAIKKSNSDETFDSIEEFRQELKNKKNTSKVTKKYVGLDEKGDPIFE